MMSTSATTIQAPALRGIATAMLESAGTPRDLAQIVAESLVDANLAGHDSHGVMRLPSYVDLVRRGRVKSAERPALVARHQATAVVDGRWGWGQPAARLATETALALAAEFGVGAVTIQRCNHIGRVGEYVEIMARSGMTGLALCNAGPAVAPYGGRERRLGTNPFAWGAPTADPDRPLIVDFATSAVAAGKLEVARAKGQSLASGLLLDAQGQPSVSPDDFFAGGALLPFGGHKGYGMSVLVEILAGILSGAAPSCLPDYHGGNGTLMLAFNIANFQPLERFVDQSSRFTAGIKSSQPATGVGEVLLPGEPEATSRRRRADAGIPLPAQTWNELCELAMQLGLRIEEGTYAVREL